MDVEAVEAAEGQRSWVLGSVDLLYYCTRTDLVPWMHVTSASLANRQEHHPTKQRVNHNKSIRTPQKRGDMPFLPVSSYSSPQT